MTKSITTCSVGACAPVLKELWNYRMMIAYSGNNQGSRPKGVVTNRRVRWVYFVDTFMRARHLLFVGLRVGFALLERPIFFFASESGINRERDA